MSQGEFEDSLADSVQKPCIRTDRNGEGILHDELEKGQDPNEPSHVQQNLDEHEKDTGKDQQAQPTKERSIHGIKWIAITLAILSNLLFYAIDNTIVAVIQPAIVRSFAEVEALPWVSVGFLMAGAATALPLGKVYGVFNAKVLYIMFAAIFLSGSAVCGASPSMTVLIVGRVIAGFGGTGMYLGALTLISVLTSSKETPTYMGYLSLIWGFGSVIGPLIGGAFADSSATWRWGFYINVVVIGASLPVYCILLPPYTPQGTNAASTKLERIDWLGSILSLGAMVSGIMAISFGGTLYPWGSWQIIVLFVVSGSLLLIFFAQQSFEVLATEVTRIFPVHLLRSKDIIICFVCQVSVAFVVPVPLYYIPLYFQFASGNTAIIAGVKTLPLIITWVTTSITRGHLMSKLGWYKPWYLVGSVLIIIGGASLSTIHAGTGNSVIYGLQILVGVGIGSFGQAGFAVAPRLVKSKEIHQGISLMLIAQLTGTTLGLALAGCIFYNIALTRIRKAVPTYTTQQISDVISGVDSSSLNLLTMTQHTTVIDAIVSASAHTYILIYTAASVSLIGAVFFTNKKLW